MKPIRKVWEESSSFRDFRLGAASELLDYLEEVPKPSDEYLVGYIEGIKDVIRWFKGED